MASKNDLKKFNRRNFILKTIGGSALLTLSINSSGQASHYNSIKMDPNRLDPLIPFQYYPELESEMLGYLRTLREKYGFRRFLLTGPSKEYRYLGFPDKQVFADLGKQIRFVKDALSSLDVEIGWWCVTTIRIGKGNFQNIIRADGSVANEACCPYDPQYQETFSDYVATVVEIARPFWINFEDDYHLNGGCYCDLHLNALASRIGRRLTREQLLAIHKSNTPENIEINKIWGDISRESLVQLATAVRRKVDQIAPETRLCLCESGNSERDGNFTESVTRAFAGKTRPAVRVHGTNYFSNQSVDLAKTLFNPLYKRQHLPPDFELVHESDTFPHTRFFMSASKLKSMLTNVLIYGLDDSLFYATQYLEDPLEEKAYCEMFQTNRRRFETIKKDAQNGQVVGCEIVRKPTLRADWVNITGRLGIPHTSRNGKVKLISGSAIDTMTDDEIKALLKTSVFLDGQAAFNLCARGFSRWIGIEAKARKSTKVPPFYERIHHAENYNIKNKLVYNYVWAFGDKEKSFYDLLPLEKTEVLTDFVGSDKAPGPAGLTRFVNEWGGRIATMAFNVEDTYAHTRSAAIFNYSKQILLQKTIAWLEPEAVPVSVYDTPNTYCVFNQSKTENVGLIAVTGLSSDTFNSFTLNISPHWKNSSFEVLTENGDWKRIKESKKDEKVIIPIQLSTLNPVVLKISKNS